MNQTSTTSKQFNGLIDTHCHIHDDEYPLDAEKSLAEANSQGVGGVICVGTDYKFLKQAIDFAEVHDGAWASVGLHPHDASKREDEMQKLELLANADSVIAIGECGLDYYYDNSPRDTQKAVLEQHFSIATAHGLPMIFHIRGKNPDSSDAYSDFWEIYDRHKPAGVIHSFSAHQQQLSEALSRGLFIGVNGIATFMNEGEQLDAIKSIPNKSLVLETDAPLLTPAPYRGQPNQPKHINTILAFLSNLRGEDEAELAKATSQNAAKLFGLKHEL